jgi:hypothetical protein
MLARCYIEKRGDAHTDAEDRLLRHSVTIWIEHDIEEEGRFTLILDLGFQIDTENLHGCRVA